MGDADVHPARRILLVVTTGGFTHAAPVFEIGRALAARGHTIELATLEGQEAWTRGYDFITRVHTLGPGPTAEQLDAHYVRSRQWDMSRGIGAAMESKLLFDSFWPQTFRGLRALMADAAARPDAMVADFFAVDAVKDVRREAGGRLALATVWPQMPFLMLPCPYIPGQPGFQIEGTLTSETASLWLRLRNALVLPRALPHVVGLFRWTRAMRRREGVTYAPHSIAKPDYLVFVNSFFGLEVPRDLPPTAAAVGPLLAPDWPPLGAEYTDFLSTRRSVIYVALGTHIILTNADAGKIVNGLLRLLEDKLIDGVIWAVGQSGRQELDREQTFTTTTTTAEGEKKTLRLGDLLDGREPDWLFSLFAPQRAILDHASTKLYFTHGGGSSANEGLFHGKPMLAMGIFMDQIANMTRLVAGGVAEPLNKFTFTADLLYARARQILTDADGQYARNVLRLQRIAHVAARRKEHAADLVEELMYDNELRFSSDGRRALRPMHLQTADMRMPAYKVNNWDLYAVVGLGLAAAASSTVFAARALLTHRRSLFALVQSAFHSAVHQ